jgi:pantetheine-phosphate adenylyltransferase
MTASRPGARAVYPGTFDPFTEGHLDIVDRARRLFDHVTVLVAVNADKQPGRSQSQRVEDLRAQLPPAWKNITVAGWTGLTVTFCQEDHAGVIIRGVRNHTDFQHEYPMAAMNQSLGVTTLFVPARPGLAQISSTAVRARGAGRN